MIATIVTVVVFFVVVLAIFVVAYIGLGWWRLPIIPRIVGSDEMAILEVVGVPEELLDSGWHLIPLWFSSLKRFPRTLFNLDYPARLVVTKAEGPYGKQELKVNSVAYVRFPQIFAWGEDWEGKKREVRSLREIKRIEEESRRSTGAVVPFEIQGGLVQILRSKVPTDEPGLKNFTEEAVIGALRVAFGGVTWVVATEDIASVRDGADKVFKSADGALIRAGFAEGDLSLTVQELILPKELAEALPSPDVARLAADAARFVSKARATKTVGAVIEMMAQARGQSTEKIQELIRKNPEVRREFREKAWDLITREMALDKDSLFDIRVGGAGGIEHFLLDLVAAFQRIPKGSKEKKKEEEKESRSPRGFGDLTPADREKIEGEGEKLKEEGARRKGS